MIRRLAKLPLRAARRVKRVVMPAADEPAHAQSVSATPPSEPAPAAAPPTPRPEPAPAPKPAAAPTPKATAAPTPAVDDGDDEVDVQVSTTPNPDAMKFTCSVSLLEEGTLSFTSEEEATGHALGEALFEFVGVRTVFISDNFVTVTKKPQADWPELIQVLEGVIGEVVEQSR